MVLIQSSSSSLVLYEIEVKVKTEIYLFFLFIEIREGTIRCDFFLFFHKIFCVFVFHCYLYIYWKRCSKTNQVLDKNIKEKNIKRNKRKENNIYIQYNIWHRLKWSHHSSKFRHLPCYKCRIDEYTWITKHLLISEYIFTYSLDSIRYYC